jgi:hypothetical protein
MRQAEAWTQAQLRAWGLKNVRKEGFGFGRGWSITSSSARMIAPRVIQLTAIPVAWTPPTSGAVTAPIVVAPMKRDRDFAKWRGKLAGKIVLVTLPDEGGEPTEPAFKRHTAEDLSKLDRFRQPEHDPDGFERRLDRMSFGKRLDAFLKAEGAVAWARMARREGKLLHGEGHGYRVGETPALPGVEIAAEDYRRLARLAKVGPPPQLELIHNVAYDDSDPNAYNIFADLPGTDPKAGYVMAGAHLDSWVAGDGAVDNAAGCAVVMEAARILAARSRGCSARWPTSRSTSPPARPPPARAPRSSSSSAGATATRSRRCPATASCTPTSTSTTARAGSAGSTARATWVPFPCCASGCSRSPAWEPARW